MINKLKEFYINYCPVFSESFIKNNTQFLFSKFVKDQYSNIALVDKSFDSEKVINEFYKRNLNPSFYSFYKPNSNFKILYTDNFLYYQNITSLYNKFCKFKSKDVSIVLVNSSKLINEYKIINDKCYGEKSSENPYSNLDNLAYSESVVDYQKNEVDSKTLIYIIKYKSINVGCIILSIKDSLCYISGLALLKDFRKTKIFTALINILEVLISENIKDVFCVTEVGEYPERLYKKIGFKSAGIAYGFEPAKESKSF